jgi:Zn finger protein HypA/HybF involved in hydrogenase expression
MSKAEYVIKGLDTDPINECLDCHHESKDWAETDTDAEEATVLCPACGSIHYYVKE